MSGYPFGQASETNFLRYFGGLLWRFILMGKKRPIRSNTMQLHIIVCQRMTEQSIKVTVSQISAS